LLKISTYLLKTLSAFQTLKGFFGLEMFFGAKGLGFFRYPFSRYPLQSPDDCFVPRNDIGRISTSIGAIEVTTFTFGLVWDLKKRMTYLSNSDGVSNSVRV